MKGHIYVLYPTFVQFDGILYEHYFTKVWNFNNRLSLDLTPDWL